MGVARQCGVLNMSFTEESSGVFILLHEIIGGKRAGKMKKKEHVSISSGELLVAAPTKEDTKRKSVRIQHGRAELVRSTSSGGTRYAVLRDPEVKLYLNEANVAPLAGAEADYLEAVCDPLSRIQVFKDRERLKRTMELKNGDSVLVKLEERDSSGDGAPMLVQGKVRYYGMIKERKGVMFGIELTVST